MYKLWWTLEKKVNRCPKCNVPVVNSSGLYGHRNLIDICMIMLIVVVVGTIIIIYYNKYNTMKRFQEPVEEKIRKKFNNYQIELIEAEQCTKCTDESFDACFGRVIDVPNCYNYRFKLTNEKESFECKYINNKGKIKDDCEYVRHN